MIEGQLNSGQEKYDRFQNELNLIKVIADDFSASEKTADYTMKLFPKENYERDEENGFPPSLRLYEKEKKQPMPELSEEELKFVKESLNDIDKNKKLIEERLQNKAVKEESDPKLKEIWSRLSYEMKSTLEKDLNQLQNLAERYPNNSSKFKSNDLKEGLRSLKVESISLRFPLQELNMSIKEKSEDLYRSDTSIPLPADKAISRAASQVLNVYDSLYKTNGFLKTSDVLMQTNMGNYSQEKAKIPKWSIIYESKKLYGALSDNISSLDDLCQRQITPTTDQKSSSGKTERTWQNVREQIEACLMPSLRDLSRSIENISVSGEYNDKIGNSIRKQLSTIETSRDKISRQLENQN